MGSANNSPRERKGSHSRPSEWTPLRPKRWALFQKSLPSIPHPQGAVVGSLTPGIRHNQRVGGNKCPGTPVTFHGHLCLMQCLLVIVMDSGAGRGRDIWPEVHLLGSREGQGPSPLTPLHKTLSYFISFNFSLTEQLLYERHRLQKGL